jgi:hypothetical protein
MAEEKKPKDSIMTKIFGNPWFGGMVLFGFASVISFFQINSYWSDQHNFNGLKGWLGIGIACGIVAIFCLYKTSKTSTGEGG